MRVFCGPVRFSPATARVTSWVVTGRPERGFFVRAALAASSSLPRAWRFASLIARSAGVSVSICEDA